MTIYMTACWQCRTGAEEVVAEALRDFVTDVQQNESGTRVYTALQEADDASRFVTFFVFEDEAAREFHRTTEWVSRFTQIIYPESVEPVVFTEYRMVASTGERPD